MRRRKRHARDAPFVKSHGVAVGSAYVDKRLSPKTDVVVMLYGVSSG